MKKISSFVFVIFILASLGACVSTGNLQGAHKSSCESPITYKDTELSIGAAYGLIGIDGEYKSTSVKDIEKEVQIYFAEAQFLCEQFQAGRISFEDYFAERKTLGREFAEAIPALKSFASEVPSEDPIDVNALWLFSEEMGVEFNEYLNLGPVHEVSELQWASITPEADGYVFVPVEEYLSEDKTNWQKVLLSSIFHALHEHSMTLKTKIKSTDTETKDKKTGKIIKLKTVSIQDSDFSGKNKGNPNFDFTTQLNYTKTTTDIGGDEKSDTLFKQRSVLSLPARILGHSKIIYATNTTSSTRSKSKGRKTRSGFINLPAGFGDNNKSLKSLIHLLEGQGVKLEKIARVKNQSPQTDSVYCLFSFKN